MPSDHLSYYTYFIAHVNPVMSHEAITKKRARFVVVRVDQTPEV